MTDEQIIRALELIFNDEKDCSRECIFPKDADVPCEQNGQCIINVGKETFDLINRQKSKISSLEYDFELLKQEKKVVEFNAVTTFVEKLKYIIDHSSIWTLDKLWLIERIDAQVNELQGELDG